MKKKIAGIGIIVVLLLLLLFPVKIMLDGEHWRAYLPEPYSSTFLVDGGIL